MFINKLLALASLRGFEEKVSKLIDSGLALFSVKGWRNLYLEVLQILNHQSHVLTGSIFIANMAILWFIFGREKKGDIIKKICGEIGLIYIEKTDTPETRAGKPRKDKSGKIIFKQIEHVPKFDWSNLPHSFTMSKVNERVSKNLFLYVNGLLKLLKQHGFVDIDSGSVSSTGFPEQYIVHLHDRQMLDQMAMFKDIRWYREEVINGLKKEYFPEISITEKDVVIRLPDELKLNTDTIMRGIETFSRFFDLKIKSFFERSEDSSMIIFKYQTPLKRLFEGKDSIPKKLEVWEDGIISKMRRHYSDEDSELAFLGELEDPNITWPSTQIFWELTKSPHFLVVGQTRSGKSKSIVSLVSTFAYAYPKSEFLFADGKGSADYDGFAKILSDYPVAKMNNGEDSLIELANIVTLGLQEYERRQQKIEEMSKRGFPCSTYVEYNKYIKKDESLSDEEKEALKIRRFFIVIDEFAEFCRDAPDSVERLLLVKGSIFWGIAKLLRAAASTGLSLCIASQRYQASDFPTPIRSNLTNWLIHNINVRDAEGIGMAGLVEKLSAGRFILRVPGLYCEDTKKNDLRCSLPYIGDDTKAMIDTLGRKEREHKSFNLDLIYNTGKESSFDKLTPAILLKMIKQAFLVREGYEILHQSNPETDYISLVFKDQAGRLYNLGIVDADEISDKTFSEKIIGQRNQYFEKSRKIFFVIGKLKDSEAIEEYLKEVFGKVHILRELDFERPLKQALEYYRESNPEKIFHKLIRLNEVEQVDPESLYVKKYKDKDISLMELNRIKNIEGNTEKGDAFEDWYLIFEKRMGLDTVKARSLIEEGIIPNIFASKRADGGFDLIRWVNREEKRVIGIQLKNHTSKNLDHKPIDKIVKSKLLYEEAGLIVERTLLVTTGFMTKQAGDEAKAVGVTVIDGGMLENMIKEYEASMPDSQRSQDTPKAPVKERQQTKEVTNSESKTSADPVDDHELYGVSAEELSEFKQALEDSQKDDTKEAESSLKSYLDKLHGGLL